MKQLSRTVQGDRAAVNLHDEEETVTQDQDTPTVTPPASRVLLPSFLQTGGFPPSQQQEGPSEIHPTGGPFAEQTFKHTLPLT